MKRIFSMAALAGILYGMGVGTIVAIATPYLEATCHFTTAQLATIVASAMLASGITTFLGGPLAELWGRKWSIVAGAAAYALGVPLICFSGGNFILIVTGLAIQGLAVGQHGVVIPLYLAESLPPAVRGRGAGFFQLFLIGGILLSGLLGVVIAYVFGTVDTPGITFAAQTAAWQTAFASVAVPSIALVILGCFLDESPEWHRGARRVEKKAAAESSAPVGSIWQKRYLVPLVIVMAILTCQQGMGANTIWGYSVKIFGTAGLSGAFVNWADLSFKFVMLIVTAVSCVLVDRAGRRILLRIGTAGCAISMAGVVAVFFAIDHHLVVPSGVSGWIVASAFALFVAAYAIGPGVCVWLLMTELLPGRIRAVGLGIALMFDYGVSSALQSFYLPFTERFGQAPFFTIMCLSAALYFVIVTFFVPETKGKPLDEIEEYFK